MSETEKIQPKVFRFGKVNEALEGVLLSIQPSKFGKIYSILTEQGEVKIFGSTVLNSRIKPEYIGKELRVVYRGVVQGRNYAYKNYEVAIKEGE